MQNRPFFYFMQNKYWQSSCRHRKIVHLYSSEFIKLYENSSQAQSKSLLLTCAHRKCERTRLRGGGDGSPRGDRAHDICER
jgi:hypothetical protein